ncbi:MAG: permease-like cell division protein FtsX [Bacteroidota bacterium]
MISEQPIKKRRKISYLPSIISISLVLFMMGIFGIILINGNKLSKHLLENFQLTVFFNEDASEADIQNINRQIAASEYAKKTIYVSKEAAAKTFAAETGQDFVTFLGFNPLLPSVELFVKSKYANAETIKQIEMELRRNKAVQDVVYQSSIIDEIHKNIRTIGSTLTLISLVFLLIAVTLINNTIRLNLFARRFIIKSMQMVGATHWFIIKPFAFRSFLHGLYGGIISCILLGLLLYWMPFWVPDIKALYDNSQFAILFVVVIIAGIIISMVSSMISTNRYLRMKIDDLY